MVMEIEAGSEVHGTKAGEYLVVKNIMFDFDKYNLNDEGKKGFGAAVHDNATISGTEC